VRLLFGLLLNACGSPVEQEPCLTERVGRNRPETRGDKPRGEAVFGRACGSCHGDSRRTHGFVPKLEGGARVADVGCGHAASTVLMAAAFPRSSFVGADYHEASIVVARRRAQEAGVLANTTFVTVDATAVEHFGDVT